MSTIVHLISGLEVGGAERMLEKTLPRLPRWKHVVCSLASLGSVGGQLRKEGITVEALGLRPPLLLRGFSTLVRFLRQARPDLLQTYLVHADVLGVLASRPAGVRRVVISIRSKLNEPKFWPVLAFYRFTSPFVQTFLFNSPATAEWYRRRGIVTSKVKVIPNGLDVSPFRPVTNPGVARHSLGLPDQGPVIVSVAKLRKEKGHRYLLEAVAQLVRSFPTLTLALVGTGPLERKLRYKVANLNIGVHVAFLGNRNDVWDILRVADAFVLPSLYEGMSNALLEAMAAAVPIVATDLPENRVLVGGDGALLVPRRDSAALVVALRQLLSNPDVARDRAMRARRSVESDFSTTKVVTLLESFYQTLLGTRSV